MNNSVCTAYLFVCLAFYSAAKKRKLIKKILKKPKKKVVKMSSLEHNNPVSLGMLSLGLQAATSMYTLTIKEKQSLSSGSQVIRETKTVPKSILSKLPESFLYMCSLSRDMYERSFQGNSPNEFGFNGIEYPVIVAVLFLVIRNFNRKIGACLSNSLRVFLSLFVWRPLNLLKQSILFTFLVWRFFCWNLPMGCCSWLKRRVRRILDRIWKLFSRKKSDALSISVRRNSQSYDSTKKVNHRKSSFERKLEKVMEKIEPSSSTLPETSVEYFHVNEDDLKAYENSLKPTEEEIRRANQLREREKQSQKAYMEAKERYEAAVKRAEKEESNDDESEVRRREEDEQFREKLAEQEREFQEEIRRIREERKRMDRELEEELQRIRQASHEKMMAFFECVQLKLRFEEKEEQVADFLNSIRKPVVNVVISHNNLMSELRNSTQENTNYDSYWLESEASKFAKKIATAQYVLDEAFQQLKVISEQYENRIFVRMMMKSISDVGQKCQNIGEKLVEVVQAPTSKDKFLELKAAISRLSPHCIPSTAYLRKNEPIEVKYPEKYVDIPNVPHPDWFPYFQQ